MLARATLALLATLLCNPAAAQAPRRLDPLVAEFVTLCPIVVFDPGKTEGVLNQRGYRKAGGDGDEGVEIEVFRQREKGVYAKVLDWRDGARTCDLSADRPLSLADVNDIRSRLERDGRIGPLEGTIRVTEVGILSKLSRKSGQGRIDINLLAMDTTGQKSTQLSLHHGKSED